MQDAVVYAAEVGVGLEEAVRRLDLQTDVGDLDAELTANEAATFAGLWIEHSPEWKVVAQFTSGGRATITPYIAGGRLADLVEIRTAPVSLATLEAAEEAARVAVDNLGIRVESQVNVFKNQVELLVLDPAQLEASLAQAGRTLPPKAKILQVEQLATLEKNIYAGLPIYRCTSGYTVKNSAGTRGITTAAHCPNDQSYDGQNLPFKAANYQGSYDVQWHTTPNLTDRPWAHDGIWDSTTPYYRIITGKRARWNQSLQEYVCKYGKTTGRTCGYIVNKSYNPGIVPSSKATWIRVHKDGVNLSGGGDSGGPWYRGNLAYGIHHCGIGDDACYMAINFLENGLNLTILTG